jgi:hypothetical protein
MRARLCFALLVIAVAVAFSIQTAPASVSAAPSQRHTSTLDDQTDLALTVYNSSIALVRDVRNVRLPPGTFDLSLWTKTDAWAAQFTIPVPVDGAAVLKYRTRVTY